MGVGRSSGQHFAWGPALPFPTRPPPVEELAKQEVLEGSTKEGQGHCMESCKDNRNRNSDGNRISMGSTEKGPAFTKRAWFRETTYWGGKEEGFRRSLLLVIKPERQKERQGPGSELRKTL